MQKTDFPRMMRRERRTSMERSPFGSTGKEILGIVSGFTVEVPPCRIPLDELPSWAAMSDNSQPERSGATVAPGAEMGPWTDGGRLACDFNSLLTIINSWAELLMRRRRA